MIRSRSHLASGVLGLSLVASITFLGCGTVLHGGRQDVTFDSKPPGATVTISNGMQFMTPKIVSLPRSNSQLVIFEKEGYEPKKVFIAKEFLPIPTLFGNLLIGAMVDLMTGAAWQLEPGNLRIELLREEPLKKTVTIMQ
jgi:hypothetical protein